MDGWAFLERCRTNPDCHRTPVLVMSAHPKLKETAGELQALYLAKPFDIDALLGTVAQLIQPPSV
jgi:CheY-like chemotaxis protein